MLQWSTTGPLDRDHYNLVVASEAVDHARWISWEPERCRRARAAVWLMFGASTAIQNIIKLFSIMWWWCLCLFRSNKYSSRANFQMFLSMCRTKIFLRHFFPGQKQDNEKKFDPLTVPSSGSQSTRAWWGCVRAWLQLAHRRGPIPGHALPSPCVVCAGTAGATTQPLQDIKK